MIEQATRLEKEFYVGPTGDRWKLTRDLQTGQPYVLHSPANDANAVELDLGSFLVLFKGQEREALLKLIASLLPDANPVEVDSTSTIRSTHFVSRWLPRPRR